MQNIDKPIQADLHSHSTISDGQLSPAEVIRLAHSNGATMVALTDHDHLGGITEAKEQANKLGITFIPGVEISTTWRERGIHVVGLNINPEDAPLQQHLQIVRAGRIERLQRMSERFAQKGINGVFEGALALATNPEMVGRAHVARFIIQQGIVKNAAQAFKKYLAEGKSAYVTHQWADFTEAVQWITEAGGIAVLAHPGRYPLSATAMRELITEFKQAGGRALEVASSSHGQNDIHNFALLAERFELFASAGSDFHALGEGGRIMGCPPPLPAICHPVWLEFTLK